MSTKNTAPSMIGRAREYLLAHGPTSAGELAGELGYAPGALGRVLSMFGEELGLIRGKEFSRGVSRVIWSADPNWQPPATTPGKKGPPELSPQQRAERAAQERLAEALRKFRQEQPRYAGGRRHG